MLKSDPTNYGDIGKLNFSEIKKELKTIKEFSNFDSWKIKKLNFGEMIHTYLFSKGKKTYFVKEVKPHEAEINYFLCLLNLSHLPPSVYPQLLENNILVMPFISGGMLRKRKISYALLREFIKFQNKMNNKEFFEKNKKGNSKFSEKDDGFFEKNLKSLMNKSYINLIDLKKEHNLQIIEKFIELYGEVEKNQNKLITEFISIPFARQHHDFREENILGKQQKLIDWGSSYGYGPFIYDLAPFLINDSKAFKILMKESDICKDSNEEQVKKWIYLGLFARLLDLLTYHIKTPSPRLSSKKEIKKAAEYEYPAYAKLLDYLKENYSYP